MYYMKDVYIIKLDQIIRTKKTIDRTCVYKKSKWKTKYINILSDKLYKYISKNENV